MNDNDRTVLGFDDLTSTFNPTTVVLAVDGTEYACTPTVTGTGPYVISAVTDTYFAGPAHPTPGGATVLAYGVHTAEARVTASDGTTLAKPFPAFRISPDV